MKKNIKKISLILTIFAIKNTLNSGMIIQQNQAPTMAAIATPSTIFDQERYYKDKIRYQRKIKALQLLIIELANVFNQFNSAIQQIAGSSLQSQAKWMQIINNENNRQGWIQRVAKVTRTDISPTVGGAELYLQQQYEMKNRPVLKNNLNTISSSTINNNTMNSATSNNPKLSNDQNTIINFINKYSNISQLSSMNFNDLNVQNQFKSDYSQIKNIIKSYTKKTDSDISNSFKDYADNELTAILNILVNEVLTTIQKTTNLPMPTISFPNMLALVRSANTNQAKLALLAMNAHIYGKSNMVDGYVLSRVNNL